MRLRPSRLSSEGLARDQGVRTLLARTQRHLFLRARFAAADHARELEAAAGNDVGRASTPYRVVLALRAPRKAERTAFDAGGPLAEPIDVGEGDRVEVDFKIGRRVVKRQFIVVSSETLLDRVCRFVTRAVCELQACG